MNPRIIVFFQLWLDNQSTMSAISSLYGRVAAALSGLRNAFFGQTRSRARLNVIASYDQSHKLFKVRIALVWLGHISAATPHESLPAARRRSSARR